MLSFRRHFANKITSLLPMTRFYPIKAAIWRAAGVDVDPDARLVSTVRIWTSGPVSIGAGTFLGHEVMIVGGNAPVTGANCDIAPRVLLVTGTHQDGGIDRAAGPGLSNPIHIREGVWVGAASTILGAVEIGNGAMIGAGSLVNKSVPAQMIAAGNPCRVIKPRIISSHSQMKAL